MVRILVKKKKNAINTMRFKAYFLAILLKIMINFRTLFFYTIRSFVMCTLFSLIDCYQLLKVASCNHTSCKIGILLVYFFYCFSLLGLAEVMEQLIVQVGLIGSTGTFQVTALNNID